MAWFLSLLPSLFKGIFGWLGKLTDAKTAANAEAGAVQTAAMQADVALVSAYTTAAMSHPIFWIAWGLGVFPVLGYHACIFFVSTFPAYGWVVQKVPDVELAYGQTVVGSVFVLTGATSLISGIASSWLKRV